LEADRRFQLTQYIKKNRIDTQRRKLNVGDIIELKVGSKIPADCVLLDESLVGAIVANSRLKVKLKVLK
jgi:magnesium-transporting ATPase (P-type)